MAKHMEYEMEQGGIREDLRCNKHKVLALRGELVHGTSNP